jgi:hypothetical protein
MKKFLTVGLYGLLALALAFGLVAAPARAADHLDAPGLTPPGGDTRLDITDVYAFQSPTNPDNTVLIVGVNPLAGVLNDGTFHPGAAYEFKIDSNGDAQEDLTYKLTFSKANKSGVQTVMLRCMPARQCRPGNGDDKDRRGDDDGEGGRVLARGKTGTDIEVRGGGMLHVAVFDDPFFFDLNAFLGTDGRSFCDGNEENFFLGLNISAIVLEVPSSWLGSNNIGVWARTVLNEKQIDRMGRPAINTVFIPNNPFEPSGSEPSQKNAFNAAKPKMDQRKFRSEIVDTLEIFYGAGNPTVDALADILLPDILTVDTSDPAGFLNGRGLTDDVIDAELALVTNGAVPSDCVGNDSAFSTSFPYLAPAN